MRQVQEKAQQVEQEKLQAQQELHQVQQQLQQERESKQTLLIRQLRKNFGEIEQSIQTQISNLSTEKLEELAEIFLDFPSINDLISWLK